MVLINRKFTVTCPPRDATCRGDISGACNCFPASRKPDEIPNSGITATRILRAGHARVTTLRKVVLAFSLLTYSMSTGRIYGLRITALGLNYYY